MSLEFPGKQFGAGRRRRRGAASNRNILAIACLAATCGGALADDPKKPAAAPITVPAVNWSGFYAGPNIGGGWITSANSASYSIVATPTGPVLPFAPPGAKTTVTGSGTGGAGITGGAQFGYNYQFGQWVLGGEYDADWTNIGNLRSPARYQTIGGAPVYFASYTGDYYGTVRARVGYALDRWLIFATGGFAYGNVGKTIQPYPGTSYSASYSILKGWTLGGGVEYALTDRFSIKAEGLYVALSGTNRNAAALAAYSPASAVYSPVYTSSASVGVPSRFRQNFAVLRLGFNYKFWSIGY